MMRVSVAQRPVVLAEAAIDLRASAAPVWFVFAAQSGVALLMAFIGAGIVVVVGAAVYSVPPPAAVGQLLLSFTVGTFAFIAFGLLIGAATRSQRRSAA
jgi:hypothetical protein